MASVTIPRGIQIVEWKNKTREKSKQLRYRVRIKRKDFKTDRLFDTLEEAKEFLALSKSKNGQNRLHEVETQKELYARAINEWMKSPNLKHYFGEFENKYLNGKQDTELKKRNITNKKSLIKTILNTTVKVSRTESGRLSNILNDEKQFGDLKIDELNDFVIDSFITSNLAAGKKKTTVLTYLTTINKFLSKLRYIDPVAFEQKLKIKTANNYDRDHFKGATTKNVVIIQDDDMKKIVEALTATKNIQMFIIAMLSLHTGLRKSEVIYLKWSDIKGNYIDLIFTKSGRPRRVYLNQQAKAVLDVIEKRDGDDRLFTYSIAGFSKVYRDLQIKYGFQHISFHQFRKNYISRLVEQLSKENSIIICELLGIANVQKFEKDHLNRARIGEVQSQDDLLKQVGHSNPQVTKDHYFSLGDEANGS